MYSKIKIYGDSDINYLWVKNKFNESEKGDIGIRTPVFDKDTAMLATFNEDISGADIKQDTNITISKYTIYRQSIGENKKYIVGEISSENTAISDYNICNNQKYKYYITPTYYNKDTKIEKMGEPIETDVIESAFYGCSIVGLLPTDDPSVYKVDTNNIWLLSIDVNVEDFKANFNKSTLNGIGRHPHLSHDTTNFLTGSISALIGQIDCVSHDYINDTVNKIEDWIDFCNNGQLKLFKDCKGLVIPCDITDMSFSYDKECPEKPTTVKFEITQLKNRKDISAFCLKE